MIPDAISDLIAGGEGATVEFRRSLARDLGRELCVFANASGGTVLVGVTDAGDVVGVADHNWLKARVLSTARSADPPIEVEVDSASEVLCIAVPPEKRKPYSFGGRFFMPRVSIGERAPQQGPATSRGPSKASCVESSGAHNPGQAPQRQAEVPLDNEREASPGRTGGREEMTFLTAPAHGFGKSPRREFFRGVICR